MRWTIGRLLVVIALAIAVFVSRTPADPGADGGDDIVAVCDAVAATQTTIRPVLCAPCASRTLELPAASEQLPPSADGRLPFHPPRDAAS